MKGKSLIERLRALPAEERRRILSSLAHDEKRALDYCWPVFARPEQLPPEGDWFGWLILAGRGWGKQLDVDTPIPTPSGWKRNGDLQAGDVIYGEHGQPVTVLAAHEHEYNDAYELVFNDGSTLVACDEHLWLTWDRSARKAYGRSKNPIVRPRVRTTREIRKTLRYDSGRFANHSIRVAASLRGNSEKLPIPPYLLGVWLGDGGTKTGLLHLSDRDAPEILARLLDIGAAVYARASSRNERGSKTYVVKINGETLFSALKRAGFIGNKHIPVQYLRASVEDRLELLRGIIDTDGHVSARSGMIEVVLTHERLARDVFELVASLGHIVRWSSGTASYGNVITGTRYRVGFIAGQYAATVSFKRDRLREPSGRAIMRRTHRYIVDVRPVGKRWMRCITVDNPSGLYLAGRSMIPTHNTRTGAEWVKSLVESGKYGRIALIAEDASDARDVMVEGASGIMGVFPPWQRPTYYPSMRRVVFHNGAIATMFSSEDPEALRGPQHHAAWIDELAKYRNAQEVWDQTMFGLRLGEKPLVCITTTPRPIPLLRKLVDDPKIVVTAGSTYDNIENLAPTFRQTVLDAYEGTRLGRQEIHGELLWDNPNALFSPELIEETRVDSPPDDLEMIVVAVDPPASANENSDECGIIVVGAKRVRQRDPVTGESRPGIAHFYVLADYTVQGLSPTGWAEKALRAYADMDADYIVAEVNQGGDMVVSVIHNINPDVRVQKVHATRGKWIRAEPVAGLYEQRRVHHVGTMPELERQMEEFDPSGLSGGRSPDRLDALVWGITELSKRLQRGAEVDVEVF